MFNEDAAELKGRKKNSTPAKVVVEDQQANYKYSVVELPSNGRLGYPTEVEYRDILVKDEKELGSASEKTFVKVLHSVLKSLLKNPDYFEELSIYDRDYLLVWVWANSYSTTKTLEVTCPHCAAKNTHVVDLTSLPVKELSEEYKNPYPFKTSSGQELTLRLLTVGDEEIARKFCTMNKDYEESYVLLCQSVDFGVVMPLREKIKRIEDTFTGKDMAFLRGFHSYFKYGVDHSVERECGSCGEVSRFDVPFQADFFLPTIQDGFGKAV